jgi:hypothetical protein
MTDGLPPDAPILPAPDCDVLIGPRWHRRMVGDQSRPMPRPGRRWRDTNVPTAGQIHQVRVKKCDRRRGAGVCEPARRLREIGAAETEIAEMTAFCGYSAWGKTMGYSL